ncbi:hypothetical protein TVAG_081040 [Trichomonas vaginalis G3]|uniref:Chromo domain-containing protein n=1 Tax=Trichomonas vaginalis (strain ATCC PRA-98 / G3) TaxID=412133 RepID=A2EPC7_TRIV3|nr:chromo domain-like family [Trichomonas vaginalis G3]EAY05512.1 hypothetical protein TVAG_081040 [Trichomonas vaginalis G3]KAI5507824.1 chromo domain-like family [Trichomonas vaginalis G3]|eukprot:XP_001317735.1 hypothetical protein [Trichomonas vaginalis G3]
MAVEIEKIVGHKKDKGKLKFMVRFQGLTIDEDCWFSEDQIKNKDLIDKYFDIIPSNKTEYILDDFLYATNDVLTLEQLRYKDPLMVVGCYKKDDLLYYRVEFKDHRYYSVESSILKAIKPKLIIDFFEPRIVPI